MTTVIPIASGKGGVGKTVLAANLGLSLASMGKVVVLVDLDLGGSNLHTLLGIRNRHPGIGEWLNPADSPATVESLIIETEYPRLFFIPGDGLLPGTANLPFFRKKRLVKEIEALTADYVLVDLGAGSAYNTVDLFLLSRSGLVVTVPEATAVLNAYAFLKTAVYRLLQRTFPTASRERALVQEAFTQSIERQANPIAALSERLREADGRAAAALAEQLAGFRPRVVVNRTRTRDDVAMGAKLREIVRKNLMVGVEYIGLTPFDEAVELSVAHRKPACALYPRSAFARSTAAIAANIAEALPRTGSRLADADDDLAALSDALLGGRE